MPNNRLVENQKVSVYATGLYQAAFAEGGREAAFSARDQLEQIVAATRENAEVAVALGSKNITAEQRGNIARGIFKDAQLSVCETVAVMAEELDFALLERVANAYETVLEDELNVTIVDVTTAVELDDRLREIISNKVSADFGNEAVLREKVDKSMLGGILMSAKGNRLNASLRWQLDNARHALKQTV